MARAFSLITRRKQVFMGADSRGVDLTTEYTGPMANSDAVLDGQDFFSFLSQMPASSSELLRSDQGLRASGVPQSSLLGDGRRAFDKFEVCIPPGLRDKLCGDQSAEPAQTDLHRAAASSVELVVIQARKSVHQQCLVICSIFGPKQPELPRNY